MRNLFNAQIFTDLLIDRAADICRGDPIIQAAFCVRGTGKFDEDGDLGGFSVLLFVIGSFHDVHERSGLSDPALADQVEMTGGFSKGIQQGNFLLLHIIGFLGDMNGKSSLILAVLFMVLCLWHDAFVDVERGKTMPGLFALLQPTMRCVPDVPTIYMAHSSQNPL